MVLLEWDGAHDLQVITDASYTVQGMDALSRRKNGRGPNRDIWTLISATLDAKQGSGVLTITKVKSHIDGVQAYCRGTPFGHILVNELADFAADHFTDHAGLGKADQNLYRKNVVLLEAVCRRIAVIEANLREYTTDIAQVAVDIREGCDLAGEERRRLIKERAAVKCKKFSNNERDHHVVTLCSFHIGIRPPATDATRLGSSIYCQTTLASTAALVAVSTVALGASNAPKATLMAFSVHHAVGRTHSALPTPPEEIGDTRPLKLKGPSPRKDTIAS